MARMPSTRSQPLNPRLAGASVPTAAVGAAGFARTAVSAPAAQADPVEARAAAARAGGFHESSYELQLGLEVSESEWPDDTTMPGSLGER